MLTVSGLAKAHGSRTLFADVAFKLAPGRRIALVGGNGTGKTTLLEIILGLQPADAGEVHRPRDLRIGYLPQDLVEETERTVFEHVADASPLADLADELHRLEHDLAAHPGDPDVIARYGEAQAHFEQQGGYAAEAKVQRILAGLGFRPDDAQRPVRELSGGWRMRTALARLLVSEPDVLMLDEPTNHLDVDSVAWLEEYLANWNGALLFVSHDRDFIDNVANRVLELAEGTALEYVGGFAEFVVAREERLAQLEASAANQARKVAEVERFIERFRYKATKARQVQSRIKTLEKLDTIAVPTRPELVKRYGFPEPRRSSRVVAELVGVSAGYDDELVLADVDLVVERGDKLALIGPNGAGKSTLLKLITGELTPFDGTATLGTNVDIATFAQHQVEVLDLDRTVIDEFKTAFGTDQGKRNPRTVLGSFGFRGDAADRKVGDLSGGEQTRLAIAKTLVNPVNLLILDEPTNHLDLPSCDLLEDALVAYPGTVLLVTHDRHLIRSVADSLVEVRDGHVVQHRGVDESVLTRRTGTTSRRTRATTGDGPATTSGPDEADTRARAEPRPSHQAAERKRDEAEQRNRRHRATKDLRARLRKVEKAWERAEARVAELQEHLGDPTVYDDADRVRDLVERHDRAKDEATRLMAEWEQATLDLEAAERA